MDLRVQEIVCELVESLKQNPALRREWDDRTTHERWDVLDAWQRTITEALE